MPTVWAVSDLHGAVKTNSERIDQLTPPDPADWLIVAGDVAERTDLIIRILRLAAFIAFRMVGVVYRFRSMKWAVVQER